MISQGAVRSAVALRRFRIFEVSMHFPATTAAFAGLFGLIYVGLTIWIMVSRTTHNVLQGDGGDEVLGKRVRVHGNYDEFTPWGLILIGLLEAGGGRHGFVLTLLMLLLIGRVLHPFGIFAPPGSPQMFACRGGGMLMTLLAIAIAAIALLGKFA